jgi:dTDP-4-dehydrorhamnose reductase
MPSTGIRGAFSNARKGEVSLMKVAVLGGSGMLGSMVVDLLSRETPFNVIATVRSPILLREFRQRCEGVEWRLLEADHCSEADLSSTMQGCDWAINCIGVIKPYIHDDIPTETEAAVVINALFPHLLARATLRAGCQVIQIATDCVFSGRRGQYAETDQHDALDAYGKTKSLGEVFSDNVHHLRVSIIGPEYTRNVSLLGWLLSQPSGSAVTGYTNHRWNGITTLHFARLCSSIICHQLELDHIQHVIPADAVSKAELLRSVAESYQRVDIHITDKEAPAAIDRTLVTANPARNQQLWAAAGYPQSPSVAQMVAELAQYDYQLGSERCVRRR